jgi:hypothetical protein
MSSEHHVGITIRLFSILQYDSSHSEKYH